MSWKVSNVRKEIDDENPLVAIINHVYRSIQEWFF